MTPDSIVQKVLEVSGFSGLNPLQKAALDNGLLDGNNMVLAAATASGKTLVAEMAMLKAVQAKKKSLYIVPLKALASEKYAEFKEKYGPMGIKVAMSVGDKDSSEPWLAGFDIIIATSEKLDSLIRHGAEWLVSVGLVVADEIHLIDSPDRGPTLEVILTRLRQLINPQILALSATISNYEELAEWLDAKAVKSDYRPVKLYSGVFHGNEVDWYPKKAKLTLPADLPPVFELAKDTMKKGKQSLVFVYTRKNAESLAEKLGDVIRPMLSPGQRKELVKLSHEISHVLEHPTRQCERLGQCLQRGAVFHHAGLVAKQRKLVEDSFRKGLIKVICATPTLCLHKDTAIWNGMSDYTPAMINEKNRLFVLNGNKTVHKKPLDVQSMESPAELIKLTTKGGKSIKLTKNHKVLVRRQDKRTLIEASECKTWDSIASLGKISLDKIKVPKWSDFIKKNDLPFEDRPLSPQIYYLLGVFLGDGYSGAEMNGQKIRYKGSPVIVNEDTELLEKIKSICKEYKINFRECKNYYGTKQLVLSKAKWFREFLVRCGVDIGVKKHIDTRILESDDEKLSLLLRGLFDTDGYVYTARNAGITSISFGLISGIQKALLRYSIICRMRMRKAKPFKMHEKEYKSKPYYEILISNSESLQRFSEYIGFGIERKRKALDGIVRPTKGRLLTVDCEKCGFVLHPSMFSGRTKHQKLWGRQKRKVIETLGNYGELGSNELKEIVGFSPRKNDRRLNHHYEFIAKRKLGANEWLWRLNDLGYWVYMEILKKDIELNSYFVENRACPLCSNHLKVKTRKNWRGKDFDGDIFWDRVRSVESVNSDGEVYDIVLPDDGSHDHLFVAEGIFVHNSAGVNLPAYRVVIRDFKRFTSFGRGMDYIPVLEIQQMCGRAGRPKYDKEGEAILIAKTNEEAKKLWKKYIKGEPEKIVSKLGMEPVLRMHVLSLIATTDGMTKESLMDFFSKTFYAHQYKDMTALERVIDNVLNKLEEYMFIETEGAGSGAPSGEFMTASSMVTKADEKINPTRIGKRVAELYIDPLSAHHIITSLKTMKNENKLSGLAVLHAISGCIEMPGLNIRKKDMENDEGGDTLTDFLTQYNQHLLGKIPNEWDIEYEDFLRGIKLIWMLNEWSEESGEDSLLENFGVTPGELRARLERADWLFYSMQELGLLLNLQDVTRHVRKTRLRVKYGIREELLPLVKLKNVGRVRARTLFNNGYISIAKLREAPVTSLTNIMGPNVAKDIKKQLSGPEKEKPEDRQETLEDVDNNI